MCKIFVFCRYFVIIDVYMKENGINEINLEDFNLLVLIVVMLVIVMLIIVVIIIVYKYWKK